MGKTCLKLKRKSFLRSERGSSVLLILAVTGAAMFLVMTSLQSQADQSYRIFKVDRLIKQDSKALKATLNFVLNATPGCHSNFANLVLPAGGSLNLSQITFGDGLGGPGATFIDINDSVKKYYGKKIVKQITLSAHPEKYIATAAGIQLSLLNLKFDDDRIITLPVYITTDGTGRILNCHSTAFLDSDALGKERTLEEKYCNDSHTPNQTSHWKPTDCMTCLAGSDPFFYCVDCKKKGKNYDASTQTCI